VADANQAKRSAAGFQRVDPCLAAPAVPLELFPATPSTNFTPKSTLATQHAKVMSRAQSHVGIDPGIEFQRQERGPYHPCLREHEATAAANKWFRTQGIKSGGKTRYCYTPGQGGRTVASG